MIKFKIEGEQYYLPEIMSIENYSKIHKVKDLFTDDYFPAKLVNIVSGAPIEDLLECDYQSISYLASEIAMLIPKDGDINFVDRFELDGIEYGFFPKWQDITFAEFVDMDTISNKKLEELLDLLHILAAIMYRPITEERSKHDFDIEKYDLKTMVKRSELFKKELDVRVILGAQFFFIKFAKKYSSYTLPFSIQKLSTWNQIKMIWMMWRMVYKITSKKSSGGFLSSTELLTMILQSTNISTKKI